MWLCRSTVGCVRWLCIGLLLVNFIGCQSQTSNRRSRQREDRLRLARQATRRRATSEPSFRSRDRDIGDIVRDQNFSPLPTNNRRSIEERRLEPLSEWDGQRFRLPNDVFEGPADFIRGPVAPSRKQQSSPNDFTNFITQEERDRIAASVASGRFSQASEIRRPQPRPPPQKSVSRSFSGAGSNRNRIEPPRRHVAIQPATHAPSPPRRIALPPRDSSPVDRPARPSAPARPPSSSPFSAFQSFRDSVQIRNHGSSGSGRPNPASPAPESNQHSSTHRPTVTTTTPTRLFSPAKQERPVQDRNLLKNHQTRPLSPPSRNRVEEPHLLREPNKKDNLDLYSFNYTDLDPFYYDYDELYDYFYGGGAGGVTNSPSPTTRFSTPSSTTRRPVPTTSIAPTTSRTSRRGQNLSITRGRLDAFHRFEDELKLRDRLATNTSSVTHAPQRTRGRQHSDDSRSTTQRSRGNRGRPTLKPASRVLSSSKRKHRPPINIWESIPQRPPALYPTPQVNRKAARCDPNICVLPDCYCGGRKNPGGFRPEETPQIVLLTFDDAVNDLNKKLYEDLFEKGRTNPNGCPIAATFYVSHEWTDYSQVQNLYTDGHEIASHTISHSFGESFSEKRWAEEVDGMREILSAYAAVKREDIRGMRAPFLQIGGNKMFKMLYDQNFTYDSSMPVYVNNPPSFPYTLDYKIHHDCMIDPCPTHSFPGVWEVPMVMWQDLKGGRCSMVDGCSAPEDAEGIYKMLIKNFERHYTSNRAPLGMYFHAAWFTREHHKEGFIAFLDTITSMEDVWMVTNWQAIQWMRDPTPLSHIKGFRPFDCHYPDRPARCTSGKNSCNVRHKTGARFMKTCQACPDVYPWTGKTGVKRL